MSNPPSGTVTFLFTDIEGSTRRWEAHPAAMRSALARHDEILRSAIESNGGYVFKTMGDAFCAAFSSPHDALSCAVDAQRAVHAEPWSEHIEGIRVRMALHTGVTEERGGDYYGQPLNRVARILSAGHGGQVLLSEVTHGLVRDNLPPRVTVTDLGTHRLKDLFRPEHIFELAAPDLTGQFAPLKTLDNRPNNLPAQLNPLIGREKELAAISTALSHDEARLLTLTGPGGTGKTRLALQAVADAVDDYPDGVWFVDLAPIVEPALVTSTVAQVLGVAERADQPLIQTVQSHLKEKQALLLLDNFEQVTDAAPQIAELLAACPKLRIVATSRVPLRIRSEREYSVLPLGIPNSKHLPALDVLSQYEAVRLFIDRAQAVKADFEVTNSNAPAVAEICVRLDGLPLAIELAAARVRLLTPQAMLTRLESRLKLLTGGAKDLPTRQQTLCNTIEWSYDLLAEQEKQVFCRLAVFAGGFALEAIEAVCGPDGDLQVDVLDAVESLISKSLLRREEAAGGEPRFVMLETIHEYAREKLDESGQSQLLKDRHLQYYLQFATKATEGLGGPAPKAWLELLDLEYDNLRAALAASQTPGRLQYGLELVGVLFLFWRRRGYLHEGVDWAERLLVEPEGALPTAARGKAMATAGQLLGRLGNHQKQLFYLEQALEFFRETDDRHHIVDLLNKLAGAHMDVLEYDRARAELEESLSRAPDGNLDALNTFGELSRCVEDFEGARYYYEQVLKIAEDLDWKISVFANLGSIAQHEGDYPLAARYFADSLKLAVETGNRTSAAEVLSQVAGNAAYEKRYRRAAVLFGASSTVLEDTGFQSGLPDRMAYERNVALAQSGLSELDWQQAWAEGRTMTTEQAVEYALEGTQKAH